MRGKASLRRAAAVIDRIAGVIKPSIYDDNSVIMETEVRSKRGP